MKIARLLIAAGLLLNGFGPVAAQNKADFSILFSVRPSKAHFKRGETVNLTYELKNVSASKKLVATSPTVQAEISLQIEGPDGKKVLWQGAVYSNRNPGVIELTLLYPSRGISGNAVLPTSCSPMGQGGFCLDKPGKYEGTAIYRIPHDPLGLADCDALVAAGPYRSERFEFWTD